MRYGPLVRLEYADLADSDTQARFPELFTLAQERNLPYPLVIFNGKLRLTGSAHYYQVMPLVERELAKESVAF